MGDGNSGEQPAAANEEAVFIPPPKAQATAALTCVLLCMFLGALCQTLVATMLPLIVADLGGFERYTWAATSYLAAATIAYPIVGSLSDAFGRRGFLVAGMAVFILGSVLIGLSATIDQVIAFRAIQGIGGGTIMTCCYVSIADLFPPAERGKYQGMIGGVYGVASLLGPLLGGVLADLISWNWAFILIGLAGLPLLWFTARIYPASKPSVRPGKLDIAGMVLLALAVAPVVSSLSIGGVQFAWSAPQVFLPLAFGLIMALAFLANEAKASFPIMPLKIYSHRVLCLALLAMLLMSLGLHGSVLMLSLYFQAAHGANATLSGALLIPMLVAMVAGGIVAGLMISKMNGGYRTQAAVHAGLFAGGMFLFSRVGVGASLLVAEICVVIAGVGFGGAAATFSIAVQNAVPHSIVGVATSALQFYRSLGGMMGMALLGVALTRGFASRLDAFVPDGLRNLLSAERIDQLQAEPDALVDAQAAASLRAELEAFGPDGPELAAQLLEAMEAALLGALNSIFALVAGLAALAFVVTLFLRVPPHAKPPPA